VTAGKGKGRPYRLFEVTGIELEYPTVDAELRAQPLVEPLFRSIAGRPTSEVEREDAVFSNELASHVFEVKTRQPERSFVKIEHQLVEGVRFASGVLAERFGARLLPTAMHPFLNPSDGRIWPRSGHGIYAAYDRVFSVAGHGWMNVQSCHINLPFGGEQETMLLHNAIACLLPYLPALTASSPIYDGHLGPCVDNRLSFYATNQARVPLITGDVIPEFVFSFRQYRSDILGRIYRELRGVQDAEQLRHEWVNSRGAIMRFWRDSIEIRTLDTQECVKMDIAVACFVRGALRQMMRWLRAGRLRLPAHAMLVEDFRRVIKDGSKAGVVAAHFRRALRFTTRELSPIAILRELLGECAAVTPAAERPYLGLVEERLHQGNLSERIRTRLSTVRGDSKRTAMIHGIYEELVHCLETNRLW